MGATLPPNLYISSANFCRDCAYFQQKWKSEYTDWSYCDYWHKDVREDSSCCDEFEEKLSDIESNGKDLKQNSRPLEDRL